MTPKTRADRLAVIVPVLNEEEALPAFLRSADQALARAAAAPEDAGVELVFADGGSTDATLGLLAGRRVVRAERGRARQCVAGLAATDAGRLLFLHADERVSPDALLAVFRALADGAIWGCLTLRFAAPGLIWRIGEATSNLRARVAGIPFGDQGMFMRRDALERVGGVPDLPIMQDYELSRRLRARFGPPRQLKAEVATSPRRFQEGGPLRVALQMRRMRALYRRGADPDELVSLYRDVREADVRKAGMWKAGVWKAGAHLVGAHQADVRARKGER